MNFETWWEKHGQFCRAGGGDYEKTFAFAAWEAATKVGAGETAKCAHNNRECTYESDDGEFERWSCNDCGERWGVEIAQ